jgi:hypothetical protein
MLMTTAYVARNTATGDLLRYGGRTLVTNSDQRMRSEIARLVSTANRAAFKVLPVEYCSGCGGQGMVRTSPDDADACPVCDGHGVNLPQENQS